MDSQSTFLRERLFWRQEFLGFSGETSMPLDYKRPAHWSGKYETIECVLSDTILSKILSLTQSNPLSLLIFFSSVWSILLQMYSGQSDIVLGTPAYFPAEQDPVPSAHIVCLRIQVPSQGSFKEFLLSVKSRALKALSHQRLPYEELLREIGLTKKRNRSTPFSTVISIPTIQAIPKKSDYRSDLFLSFETSNQSLTPKIEYHSDLFHAQSMEYLGLHFQQLLSNICSNLEIPLDQLDCLTPLETKYYQNQLDALKTTSSTNSCCIHTVFEDISVRFPKKTAIELQDSTFTYQELNQRANVLAHYLIDECELALGEFVGFIGERNVEYLIATLGILKAGGAFIPMDSSYPVKRIQAMLENSQVRVILTTSKARTIFSFIPLSRPIKVLEVDLGESKWDTNKQANPERSISAQSPAYMIYTSGSTGHPKGVVIRHDGKMNHLLSSQTALSLNQDSIVLFSASIATDISIWQALVALLCGGKTVIIDQDTLLDHDRFWSYLENKHVQVMQLVPTFLHTLLSYLENQADGHPQLPQMQCLILSGEEASPGLVNRWFNRFRHIPLLNAYGPSEASDIVSQELFIEPVPPSLNHLSIGQALPHVQLFVLDQRQRLQPFFIPGEIYIAGIAVGEGYWQDREKTTLSFVPHPFDPTAKGLWYRTGDLGRFCLNSTLEYLGRLDSQVKIRGYRVEVSEVETRLLTYPLVKQCKVHCRRIHGQDTLCAWVIADDKAISSSLHRELKAFLSTYLPDYMVPAYIQLIKQFPLLGGGKIDLQALPNPEEVLTNKIMTKPKDDLERKMCELLSKTVGISIESIGMESNFFDLGGTSLHLMAMKYQMKEQLAVDMPIEELFRINTVQELVEGIRGR